MIRFIRESDREALNELLLKEKGINYFVLTSLMDPKPLYKKLYGFYNRDKLIGFLGVRISGNAQLYSAESFDHEGIHALLKEEGVKSIIAEKGLMTPFVQAYALKSIDQSWYMTLDSQSYKPILATEGKVICHCVPEDAPRIKALYGLCFMGSLPETLIYNNLKTHGGRGYYAQVGNELISVAQTIFEDQDSAILYGVATLCEQRKKGYSRFIINTLLNELIAEGKEVSLLVDDENVARFYESFGFQKRMRLQKTFL